MASKPGRPTKDFLPDTRFGDLTVVGKVRTPARSPGGQRYRVKCVCGTRLTLPRFYLVREQNPKRHCGCKTFRQDPKVIYTRNSWYAMMSRCYYEGHVSYKDYGGRGISVCERWHSDNPDGFKNFLEDMELRPKNLSLDRIDPNGNYEPSNCKWATASEQTMNQRWRKSG